MSKKKITMNFLYGDDLQFEKSVKLVFESEADRIEFESRQEQGWLSCSMTDIGKSACGNPTRIKRV